MKNDNEFSPCNSLFSLCECVCDDSMNALQESDAQWFDTESISCALSLTMPLPESSDKCPPQQMAKAEVISE